MEQMLVTLNPNFDQMGFFKENLVWFPHPTLYYKIDQAIYEIALASTKLRKRGSIYYIVLLNLIVMAKRQIKLWMLNTDRGIT